VTFYCFSCWNEVGTANVCPQCGADLHDLAGESYEEKLIRALYHREPTVPVRAATILGELGSRSAVEPLIEVANSSQDPYIQEAAVNALGRIGDLRALPCLDRLGRGGMLRVRRAADQAIRTLRKQPNAAQE
jgi:HEAT repeat protein